MRAILSIVAVAGAGLLAAACSSNEEANVVNTVEIVPVENVVVTETLTTTNIDAGSDENMAVSNVIESEPANAANPL